MCSGKRQADKCFIILEVGYQFREVSLLCCCCFRLFDVGERISFFHSESFLFLLVFFVIKIKTSLILGLE